MYATFKVVSITSDLSFLERYGEVLVQDEQETLGVISVRCSKDHEGQTPLLRMHVSGSLFYNPRPMLFPVIQTGGFLIEPKRLYDIKVLPRIAINSIVFSFEGVVSARHVPVLVIYVECSVHSTGEDDWKEHLKK